jgi:hypothetical protein
MMAHRDLVQPAVCPDVIGRYGSDYGPGPVKTFRAFDPDDALFKERPQ